MGKFVELAKTNEVDTEEGLLVEVEGRNIALFRVEEKFYAIDDSCSHRGASLSMGEVDGLEVECPFHAARFSLETGEVLCAPASEAVNAYPLKIEDGTVYIDLE